MRDQTCAGCGKPAPTADAAALTRWAAINQAREIYCPDCLTPGEAECLSAVAAQMIEEKMLLDRRPDARKGVFVPEQRTGDSLPTSTDEPVSKS
jgi:hypothetical protein